MNEPIAHSGVWALALIMIMVAFWGVYRYLAPKTWREWAGAGLVGEGVEHSLTRFSVGLVRLIGATDLLLGCAEEQWRITEVGAITI